MRMSLYIHVIMLGLNHGNEATPLIRAPGIEVLVYINIIQ